MRYLRFLQDLDVIWALSIIISLSLFFSACRCFVEKNIFAILQKYLMKDLITLSILFVLIVNIDKYIL